MQDKLLQLLSDKKNLLNLLDNYIVDAYCFMQKPYCFDVYLNKNQPRVFYCLNF